MLGLRSQQNDPHYSLKWVVSVDQNLRAPARSWWEVKAAGLSGNERSLQGPLCWGGVWGEGRIESLVWRSTQSISFVKMGDPIPFGQPGKTSPRRCQVPGHSVLFAWCTRYEQYHRLVSILNCGHSQRRLTFALFLSYPRLNSVTSQTPCLPYV